MHYVICTEIAQLIGKIDQIKVYLYEMVAMNETRSNINLKVFENNKVNETLLIISVIIFLLIPAHFINLGKQKLIDDEAIRAIVALEMKISGDYITPTIAGDFYFKKPPVFNWLIAAAYNISGDYSELPSRVINVLFLFVFCYTIYYVIKKRYNKRVGYLTAFIFLVSARILFYESLYGLIDITYSWIIFLNFSLIYKYSEQENFKKLFIFSYILSAVAFLLKGLPAIAFQGITLLVAFISGKKFKMLFSVKHIIGFAIFVLIVGLYYYLYYLKNPEQLSTLLLTVFHESADKSVFSFGLKGIVAHFFSYLSQIIYGFLPGTLILLFFIKRKPFEIIRKDGFLIYLSKVLIFNILIYLVSPVSFLRYVIMFIPIICLLFIVHYDDEARLNSLRIKILDTVFLSFSFIWLLVTPIFAIYKKRVLLS